MAASAVGDRTGAHAMRTVLTRHAPGYTLTSPYAGLGADPGQMPWRDVSIMPTWLILEDDRFASG